MDLDSVRLQQQLVDYYLYLSVYEEYLILQGWMNLLMLCDFQLRYDYIDYNF